MCKMGYFPLGRETNFSPTTSAEAKDEWSYNSTSYYAIVFCLRKAKIYF